MANGQRGSVAVMKSIETLFRVGAVGGMADAELVELFLTRPDAAECAFEALVQRHGSMVLGVCRGILPDSNDAEDAFQATFLVLARRASSVRSKGSIGSWLHGVARRVSMRAKVDASRRRLRESEAAGLRPEREMARDDTRDLSRILQEELGRLPEKYQMPVLLCDAEGLTHESAAKRLGWPVGTVSGRLSRAHGLLRDRLKRRGVEPTSIVVGAITMPAALIGTTARAALQFASGGGVRDVAGTVSVGAIALAEGVLKMMSMTRMIVAGTIVMAGIGLTSTGVGLLAVRGQGAADKPKVEIKEPTMAPKPTETRPRTTETGSKVTSFIVNPVQSKVTSFIVNPEHPNPEVLKAIREAAKVAETIPEPGTKILTLMNVAEAYANTGDVDSAKATYRKAMGCVEESFRSKKDTIVSGGTEVLRDQPTIPNFSYILRIAESQATHNFIEDAAETVKTVDPRFGSQRNDKLIEFTKALAQDGKIQSALRVASEVKNPIMGTLHTEDSLKAEIAHIQAKDFPKSDRTWIDKLTDPAVKSRVLLGVAAGLSGQRYKPSRYGQHKAQ